MDLRDVGLHRAGCVELKRKKPSWIDIPQMMRLNVSTYNVLKMLAQWQIARPYNFLLLPMVDPLFGYVFHRRSNEKVLAGMSFFIQSRTMAWPGMR